jgi:outer membrane lipoprotein-sorting protein
MLYSMTRVILIGSILTTFAIAAGPLETTLAHMDQSASKFTGLSADLRRAHHTAVIDEDTLDIGTILIKRPKPHDTRMLFDVKEPDPKQAAIDSRKLQIYLPKTQTVTEYDLGKYRAMVDEYLLLGFGSSSKELQNVYAIALGGADTLGGEKTTRLELTPKSQDALAHLKRVDLWISDTTGLPVQQKFYLPGGDYDLATFGNMKLNPNLPDSAVKLDLPRGVKREYPQK